MNHKPKMPGVVFYVKQRMRIQERIQQVRDEIRSMQIYPAWLQNSLNAALSPFSLRVRAIKSRLRVLQAEYRRLQFKLRMMLSVPVMEVAL
jgi:chaperonin cofactor prefoldin